MFCIYIYIYIYINYQISNISNTQVLLIVNSHVRNFKNALDKSENICVPYMNLSKAFATINYNIHF